MKYFAVLKVLKKVLKLLFYKIIYFQKITHKKKDGRFAHPFMFFVDWLWAVCTIKPLYMGI